MAFDSKNIFYGVVVVIFIILIIISHSFFKGDKIKNYSSKGTDIIAFGDSLVEGIGSTGGNDFVSLLSKKVGKPIINLGVSGNTTEDGLNRLKELDSYKPKIILLLLGGNDHLRKVPIDETFSNLGKIIENMQSRGAIVLLLGVKGNLFGDKFKSEFQKLSGKYETAYVPNVLDGLFGNTKYMSDSIHPNDLGYSMIAEKIYPVLYKLLK